MRIDRFLCELNIGSRREVKELLKKGEILINGKKGLKPDDKVDELTAVVSYRGKEFRYRPYVYYMMNKPKGYICANYDKNHLCVVDLIERNDCICVGRLDKDTTGFLLLTNDKSIVKALLLPQNHQPKTYLVTTRFPIDENSIYRFEMGIVIDQDICCLPAQLELINTHQCYLTLHEGKYHQVKKMFLSCQNEVVDLKRIAFAGLVLDASLGYGEYRQLNQDEFQKLKELVCQ